MSNLHQFNWSLRPFVIFMRCIGIYLPDGEISKSSKFKRIIQSLHMWMSFLLNFSIQTGFFLISFRSIMLGFTGIDKLESMISKMSSVIDHTNYGFSSILGHLILLLVVRPRWNILMNCLIRLESEIEPQYFNKIRRFSIAGVCLVLFTVRLISFT